MTRAGKAGVHRRPEGGKSLARLLSGFLPGFTDSVLLVPIATLQEKKKSVRERRGVEARFLREKYEEHIADCILVS